MIFLFVVIFIVTALKPSTKNVPQTKTYEATKTELNGIHVIEGNNGFTYSGEVKNGKIDGWTTITYSNGFVIKQFSQDGLFKHATAVGPYKYGYMHGTYTGSVNNGFEASGNGKFVFKNASGRSDYWYDGEWVSGEQTVSGTRRNDNILIRNGNFLRGVYQGGRHMEVLSNAPFPKVAYKLNVSIPRKYEEHIDFWIDDKLYNGNWKSDHLYETGYGRRVIHNHSHNNKAIIFGYALLNSIYYVYEGNIKDGFFHGHGTLLTNTGQSYTANFVNGCPYFNTWEKYWHLISGKCDSYKSIVLLKENT